MFSRRAFLGSIGVGALSPIRRSRWVYQPGFAVDNTPREDHAALIHLDHNENPYGPSEKVRSVLASSLPQVNRYPIGEHVDLVNRIAQLHGVKPGQVILGCGSTEILRTAAEAFLGKEKQLVLPEPTYGALGAYAAGIGTKVRSVPLNHEFAHDLEGMLARASDSTGLVYICNPNNPTASLTPRKDLETFIGKLPAGTHVIIDEAYHHYVPETATYTSFLDPPINDDRTIVCRTFSTTFALAGLRLGYAVAHPQIVQQLLPYATQNGINAVAIRAALASLDDPASIEDYVRRNADVRQEFLNQAMARMLKPIDSHTNFVMMNIYSEAEGAIEHFRTNNILIGRRFSPMDHYIRISLGTPEEMRAFWIVWDKFPYAKIGSHH